MTKPEVDPIVEILKHIFVLKVSHRRVSEAKQLEDSIDELFSQGSDIETAVDPVLWLLIELKNFRTDIEPVLVELSSKLIISIQLISSLK